MANLARGFRRLAAVVSILAALPFFALGAFSLTGRYRDPQFAYLMFAVGGVALTFVWIIYVVGAWIGAGFKRSSSEENQVVVTAEDEIADVARASLDAAATKIGNR